MDTISAAIKGFTKNWWVLLIRGILAIIFGILAFTYPGPTLVTIVILFGIYALSDGLTAIWIGAKSRDWWLLFAGIVGCIMGILTFIYPDITALGLFYMIAVWAIIKGVFEIVSAIQLRKEIDNEWLLIIGGLFSILFGSILLFNPLGGVLTLIYVIGYFALTFGVMMIIFSFRLKSLTVHSKKHSVKSDTAQKPVLNGTKD